MRKRARDLVTLDVLAGLGSFGERAGDLVDRRWVGYGKILGGRVVRFLGGFVWDGYVR